MKIKIPQHENINTPNRMIHVLQAILQAEPEHDQEKEHFWIIALNHRHNIKYIELVSLGTLNSSLVHPREVFRYAIMQGTSGIILAHNHPSGYAQPSDNDIAVTKRLKEAGDIIGIQILDHVIVGNGTNAGFLSMKEAGYI